MKITALKQQQKNPERVSIFVDGKYCFSLTIDQLLQEQLKKEDELDSETVERLKKVSQEGKVRARALEWVMSRPHSEKELRDYLYRKKTDKDLIDSIAQEFTAKRYIDDVSFARWFAEGRLRKNKSMRSIKSELASKGIAHDIAHTVLHELASVEQETEVIGVLVTKLRKRERYKDDRKLTALLISRGFSYEDIKKVLATSEDESI